MAALQEKFNKSYMARAKLKAELSIINSNINNPIDRELGMQDKKIKIDPLIGKCKDNFVYLIEKNAELLILHIKLKIRPQTKVPDD